MVLLAKKPTTRTGQLVSAYRRLWRDERVVGLVCVAPALALLSLILVYPLAYSLYQSLLRNNLVDPPTLVGLHNYGLILQDGRFWNSLRVTAIFAFVTFSLQLLIGFSLALLLHEIHWGKGLFRTLIVMPLMLSPIILGLNWRMMLNYDFGLINYLVGLVGIGPVGWTIREATSLPTLIAVEVWHTTGFVMLILSAGLAAMPSEVLEASIVDGASRWQRLFLVIIPLLKPVILVVCLFRSYELIRSFDKVLLLTRGGPGIATESLTYYIYQRMFQGLEIGYSSALSWVMFAISLAISFWLMRSMRLYQETD